MSVRAERRITILASRENKESQITLQERVAVKDQLKHSNAQEQHYNNDTSTRTANSHGQQLNNVRADATLQDFATKTKTARHNQHNQYADRMAKRTTTPASHKKKESPITRQDLAAS